MTSATDELKEIIRLLCDAYRRVPTKDSGLSEFAKASQVYKSWLEIEEGRLDEFILETLLDLLGIPQHWRRNRRGNLVRYPAEEDRAITLAIRLMFPERKHQPYYKHHPDADLSIFETKGAF